MIKIFSEYGFYCLRDSWEHCLFMAARTDVYVIGTLVSIKTAKKMEKAAARILTALFIMGLMHAV